MEKINRTPKGLMSILEDMNNLLMIFYFAISIIKCICDILLLFY